MIKKIFYLIALSLILCSCNNSLTVLNRKYRSGYTFSLSSKKPDVQLNTHKKLEEHISEIKISGYEEETENDFYTCSNSTVPAIINHTQTPVFFVSDTIPKKSVDEPWALYKPEPLDKEISPGKRIEPFHLASELSLLSTTIISALLKNPFPFLILYPTVLILSIFSLRNIHRFPSKYVLYSKIVSIIYLIIGGFLTLVLLFAAFLILASF